MSDRQSSSLARDWISSHPSSAVAWLTLLALVAFILWARAFEIDEVARGAGKVIPASREQVVQSLEGGSYTHLTLPAKKKVYITVGAG